MTETESKTPHVKGLMDPSAFSDEGPEYLGVIITDAWTDTNYGERWHLAIRPVDSATGKALNVRLRESTDKRSGMYRVIESFFKTFGKKADGEPYRVGYHELEGQAAWFARKTLSFGKDQNGDPITQDVQLAKRPATKEEAELAHRKIAEEGDVAVSAAPELASAAELDPGTSELLLALIDGKSPLEAQKAVAKAALPQEVKNGFLQGTILPALIAAGRVVLDDQRVAHAVEAVAS